MKTMFLMYSFRNCSVQQSAHKMHYSFSQHILEFNCTWFSLAMAFGFLYTLQEIQTIRTILKISVNSESLYILREDLFVVSWYTFSSLKSSNITSISAICLKLVIYFGNDWYIGTFRQTFFKSDNYRNGKKNNFSWPHNFCGRKEFSFDYYPNYFWLINSGFKSTNSDDDWPTSNLN